jgi:indolepyruvate decarboxylase
MHSNEISRRHLLQASAGLAAAANLPASGFEASAAAATPAPISLPRYIARRLAERGVTALFGVPGATCDEMFTAARAEKFEIIVTSSDLEAGYAADGYARLKGLGAVCVTYGVGTMSLVAAIGGAYAERSPLVLINGGPSAADLAGLRNQGLLFSHSIGKEQADFRIFSEVTAHAVRVTERDATRQVDAALSEAIRRQRPVYIEVPKDLWNRTYPAPASPLNITQPPTGEEPGLARTIINDLQGAARPALLLGIEIQRYGLAKEAAALVERLQIPYSTTMLAKSVIPETTTGFVGVYDGVNAPPSVRQIVEKADTILALGCVLGYQLRNFVRAPHRRKYLAADGTVREGTNARGKMELRALIRALHAVPWTPNAQLVARTRLPGLTFEERRKREQYPAAPVSHEAGLRYEDVLRSVSNALNQNVITISDTSLSMYPAADLNVVGTNAHLCNGVWQSIGYSVGAAVGVAVAQGRRPLVICGDGGFQMTAQALSTLVKYQLKSTVVVLDNGLHAIEQWLLDSSYFNSDANKPIPFLSVHRWNYAAISEAMGFTFARAVATTVQLDAALKDAATHDGPALIAATLKQHDLPSDLRA